MASQYYASIGTNASQFQDVDHSGTSSTSTDFVEVRMGNGTYTPDRHETIKALERIIRWLVQGGTDQAGANLPNPSGPN